MQSLERQRNALSHLRLRKVQVHEVDNLADGNFGVYTPESLATHALVALVKEQYKVRVTRERRRYKREAIKNRQCKNYKKL